MHRGNFSEERLASGIRDGNPSFEGRWGLASTWGPKRVEKKEKRTISLRHSLSLSLSLSLSVCLSSSVYLCSSRLLRERVHAYARSQERVSLPVVSPVKRRTYTTKLIDPQADNVTESPVSLEIIHTLLNDWCECYKTVFAQEPMIERIL